LIVGLVVWGVRSHARAHQAHCDPATICSWGNGKTTVVLVDRDWTPPQMPKAPRPPAPPRDTIASRSGKAVLTWEATSSHFHAKEADAYQDALDVARSELLRKMPEIKPDSDLQPDMEAMEKFVRGKEVLPETLENDDDRLSVVKVKLKLEMSPTQRDELLRKVRMSDAWQRQLGMGKGLLIVLAVLATLAGYFKLEDRTKGYCAGWLKLGMVLLLALLGIGFFVLA